MSFNVNPTGQSYTRKKKITNVTPNTGQHLHVSYTISNSNIYFEFVEDVTGTAKRRACVVDTHYYISMKVNIKVLDIGTAESRQITVSV